ncbi:MAG: tRNA (adenosine(37)-N6)-threonylcarbamoyltransferase complex ATPase subunit type 1 TsaE, partial [Rhodothermales bacterium]
MTETTTDTLFPTDTFSPADTLALGRRLAERLQPGDVVALYGELGAGKTHLIKGICTAYALPEAAVTSPTFTLVNEYAGRAFPVYHFDAYRIKRIEEFFELGYEEYFYGDGLCLIEWPERIEPLLPEHTLRLRLSHLGGHQRRIAR